MGPDRWDLNAPVHDHIVILKAIQLLAGMRLWGQLNDKDDQAIREIFEARDPAPALKGRGCGTGQRRGG
jgi:hypothetical protein